MKWVNAGFRIAYLAIVVMLFWLFMMGGTTIFIGGVFILGTVFIALYLIQTVVNIHHTTKETKEDE